MSLWGGRALGGRSPQEFGISRSKVEVQNCLVFERKNRDLKKIEIKGEIMVDELTRNYEKREWTIRHIPVRVKESVINFKIKLKGVKLMN